MVTAYLSQKNNQHIKNYFKFKSSEQLIQIKQYILTFIRYHKHSYNNFSKTLILNSMFLSKYK